MPYSTAEYLETESSAFGVFFVNLRGMERKLCAFRQTQLAYRGVTLAIVYQIFTYIYDCYEYEKLKIVLIYHNTTAKHNMIQPHYFY
ncbi:uncharacterized protein Dvar_43860 [Desulfosarcina variabilis str. Montpellier]